MTLIATLKSKHTQFKFQEFAVKQADLLLTCIAIESESTNLQFALGGLNQLLLDLKEAAKETKDELDENCDVRSTDSDSTLQSEHYHHNR